MPYFRKWQVSLCKHKLPCANRQQTRSLPPSSALTSLGRSDAHTPLTLYNNMKSFAILALAALLALVRSTDACADVAVYQACIQEETNQLHTCGTTDWVCQCPWEKAILTCYNDCPDDANVQQQALIQQGQVTTICTAANQTLAASSAAAAASSVTPATPSSVSMTNTLLTVIPSSTTSPSATASQKSAASANRVASGVLVVGFAVVALLAL
ncbi:hypothetical protein BC937DRAFT_86358 [Endogone sp. FLAS-F59071]|nr:hypothetical protein BC937DRAFT_86358 [Endogone sp. FLAS-F59071]|eukprot:RUS13094.1 hypothetical protein BC937DRAFT_86358 [Endogone sp. FLAS-F59071]